MNVTVLSYFFLPEYSGGAKQWFGIMKRIKEQDDINFTVIAAGLNREWPEKELIDGIHVTRVSVNGNNSLFRFWLNASLQLWRNRETIDLVQANGLNQAHGFPLWFAHCLGKPTIGRLSIANSDVSFSTQGRLLGRLHRWCLNHVDKYVAISSELVREIGEAGLPMNKCLHLHNGVDVEVYRPASGKDKRAVRMGLGLGEETIVLFVGVKDQRKGVDVLISAFKRVSDVQQDVRLLMVGPGNRDDRRGAYVAGLKAMALQMGISEKVDFREFTKDVIQYYHAADLLVLPSWKEGMPNVVLEAMACCLPVVGTRISGTEDLVIPGETGLLVPPGDTNALADAIIKLINDPKKRSEMGEKGRKSVKERHDMQIIASSYIELYLQLQS